jgi:hypothetical protein
MELGHIEAGFRTSNKAAKIFIGMYEMLRVCFGCGGSCSFGVAAGVDVAQLLTLVECGVCLPEGCVCEVLQGRGTPLTHHTCIHTHFLVCNHVFWQRSVRGSICGRVPPFEQLALCLNQDISSGVLPLDD